MDHNVNLITTLALGFGLALVFGVIAERIKLPALIGYLFAGVVLGPLTPGEALDRNIAAQLAEVGVMLLMFGVGLHFSFKDFMEVRRIAAPGAALQMLATTAVSTAIVYFSMDLALHSALALGFCLSCASTVVLLKTLESRNKMGTMTGKIAVGWLIVEDMITVLALVLLPAIAGVVLPHARPALDHVAVIAQDAHTARPPPLAEKAANLLLEEVANGTSSLSGSITSPDSVPTSSFITSAQPDPLRSSTAQRTPVSDKSSSFHVSAPVTAAGSASVAMPGSHQTQSAHKLAQGTEPPSFVASVVKTLALVGVFMGLMLVAGKRFLPWILYQVAKTGSRELFTLSVVSIVIGIAYGASVLFHVSFALGAFIAGMVMRESEFSHRAAQESMPLRDAFAVLFFVSVGLLLDLEVILKYPLQLMLLISVVIFFKPLVSASLAICFKFPVRTALTLGVSLAQIGEFSFIFAGAGMGLGLISADAFSMLVAISIVSIAVNPFLLSAVEPLARQLIRRYPGLRALETARQDEALPSQFDIKTLAGHIILVGHGHVGAHIAKDLKEKGLTVVVVEQNRDRVLALRQAGSLVVHGEGCDVTSLDIAHAERALAMVIATKDVVNVPEMVRQARLLNEYIEIVIKCRNEDEWRLLTNDLAHHSKIQVIWAEEELARNVARQIAELARPQPAFSAPI